MSSPKLKFPIIMQFSLYSADALGVVHPTFWFQCFVADIISSFPLTPLSPFWSLSFACFHTPPATDHFKGGTAGCHPSPSVLPTRTTLWDSKISLTWLALLMLCNDGYIRPPHINTNFQVLLHNNYPASINAWTIPFLPFPASSSTVQYKGDFPRLNYIFLHSILHLSHPPSCFPD